MSEHKNLSVAFVAASAELKNPKMDAKNPHFKSKFASLLSCEAAVRPVLAKHGLALVQCLGGEQGMVSVETIIMHENGESKSFGAASTSPDREGPQAYGSAVTYLRRYGLLAALGLVGDPDDDAEAATDHGGAQKPARKAPEGEAMTRKFIAKRARELWGDEWSGKLNAQRVDMGLPEGKDMTASNLVTFLAHLKSIR